MRLSVIIVSWNTLELVNDAIKSAIENIPNGFGVEIIVIDNASSDGTADYIERNYPSISSVRNSSNIGFANAVNQGAKVAEGEYLLLLNSDAKLLDGDITKLISVMDEDHQIGICTGNMVNRGGDCMPSYSRFASISDLVRSFTINKLYRMGSQIQGKSRGVPYRRQGLEVRDVDWVSGGYMLVRRELVVEDGLFDSRIFMYYEDALLCKRAWDSGYRVVHIDSAPVLHEHGASAKKVRIKSIQFSYESSRLYVQNMYGQKALARYETMVRSSWVVLKNILLLMEKIGFKRIASPKRALFENLLAVPRLT